MAKREVDIVVISDVHSGTYGCQAKELLSYLKSIRPKKLILNGDIIDVWQFRKWYWPEEHMKVVSEILKFVAEGVPVYYVTGNHDEMLRRFADFNLGTFRLLNEMVLDIDGKKVWIFHGDVFDVAMQHSKWLAKLGAIGYDTLIILNSLVNWFLTAMGKEKMSFSKKIKGKFKDAVKFINQFEQTVVDMAVENNYSYVICGHIHHPEIRQMEASNGSGKVVYLNSGDWVESLTSLEYNNNKWTLFTYNPLDFKSNADQDDRTGEENLDAKTDVKILLERFKQKRLVAV
jgi:UDP-2,3-diacylglucosamine pyrophosphatase LpxH